MGTHLWIGVALLTLSHMAFSLEPDEDEKSNHDYLLNQKLILRKPSPSSLSHLLRDYDVSKCCFCCCKRGRQGPPGPAGPPGPIGPQGPIGPAFSTASASFNIPATQDGPNVSVDAFENFPFQASYFTPQGITYNSTNNNFTFSQTGLYLVSYGASIDQSSAFISLFYNNNPTGGTMITGSQVYINNRDNLFGATIIVPITSLSQTLSLVNSSLGTLSLHVGFEQALGAYITITRVGNLP